jgi:hypothetical protein
VLAAIAAEDSVLVSILTELETEVQLKAKWLGGSIPSARYKAYRRMLASGITEFAPGDVLMAITDGMTDAQNPQGQLLGIQTVTDLLQSEWGNIETLIARVEDKVFNHMGDTPQFDDMTFWVLEREANADSQTEEVTEIVINLD